MIEQFNNKDWSYKLTKLELHQAVDEIYLEAEYETENIKEKGILHIPKIPLCITDAPTINVHGGNYDPLFYGYSRRVCDVDLGFGYLRLDGHGTAKDPWFTYKVTEEKVQELTLEEIEKKLGHKVKIVSDK